MRRSYLCAVPFRAPPGPVRLRATPLTGQPLRFLGVAGELRRVVEFARFGDHVTESRHFILVMDFVHADEIAASVKAMDMMVLAVIVCAVVAKDVPAPDDADVVAVLDRLHPRGRAGATNDSQLLVHVDLKPAVATDFTTHGDVSTGWLAERDAVGDDKAVLNEVPHDPVVNPLIVVQTDHVMSTLTWSSGTTASRLAHADTIKDPSPFRKI